MKLYFLRHAIAAEPGTKGASQDSERPLTDDGIQETKKSLRGFKALGLEFDAVVSSPYRRAKHTAEIVSGGLRLKQKILFTEALEPHAGWKEFSSFIRKFGEKDKILLVGHQPTMGQFISSLICGNPAAQIDLKKGGLALVEIESSGSGELKWLLTAKQLGDF